MKQIVNRLPIAVIAIIGIGYAIMALMMPLLGDDMGYAHNYLTHYGSPTDMPLIMARHWLHVNSRMADMLNAIWLGMIPRWCLALMCGLMVAFYFILTARCARLTTAFGRILLTALLLLTMPWWDSFFLFVCQFNYVWSSVLVLTVLAYVSGCLHIPGRWAWIMVPFSLMAGWMHEAAGLSAACGLMAWIVTTRCLKSLSAPRRWTIALFCLGAAMSATSPASWSRAAHVAPNDPLWLLLLKSDFYALLLTAYIGYMALLNRPKLRQAIHSPWMIFATASLASMCISGIGGIVGRSGWFAQTFALIALFWPGMMLSAPCPSKAVSNSLVVTLSLLMSAHMAEVVRWQLRADTEISRSLNGYTQSADGAVYMNPLGRYNFPAWNLCKNKGVPDADDFYLTETIDRCMSQDTKRFRILPPELSGLSGKTLTDPLKLPTGFVTATRPPSTDPAGLFIHQGAAYTVTPFTTADSTRLYYIAPRILDPGDR